PARGRAVERRAGARRGTAGHAANRAPARCLPGAAVRRGATAGCDRPGAGEPADGAAGRRADRSGGQRHRGRDRRGAARAECRRADADSRDPQPGARGPVHAPGDRARRRSARVRPGGATMTAVIRAARGGLGGRRLQAVIIGLVALVSTAAATLAVGMLVDAHSPFDHAFASQHGAHVTATVDTSVATPTQLAATTHLSGVSATAGPFASVSVTANVTGPGGSGSHPYPLQIVGRPSA